jgi:alcohol dehydrogenase
MPNAGNINYLKIREEILDDPADHEVQVSIGSIGLNFADIFTVWGMYEAAPKKDFIPGLEYAGTVIKKGAAVRDLNEGDQIMGITRFGAYCSHLNIDANYVSRIPAGWSADEGAAFLVQVLTAYYGLVTLGNIQPGQNILIHSGAGGVGIQANRIAKHYNATTIGTVGNEKKLALLEEEGFDHGLVRSHDFKRDLLAMLADRPLNIIMECIGGRILKEGFELLAPEGRMIVYGSASFATHGNKPNKLRMLWNYLKRPKIDPLTLPGTNRSIMGFNLIWLYERVEKLNAILKHLEEIDLPPPRVGHKFAFHELPVAMRLFLSGQTTGKVIVNVGDRG